MGLPPTSAPLTPGLNFATINAETLEAAQQEMEFKVPEEKVIDKVRRSAACRCFVVSVLAN